MQFSSVLTAALFVAGAIASPIGKREIVTKHETVVVYETPAPEVVHVYANAQDQVVTKTAAPVIVWVDANGKHIKGPAPTPAHIEQPPVESPVVEVETVVETAAPVVESPAPVEPTPESTPIVESPTSAPVAEPSTAPPTDAGSSGDFGLDASEMLKLHNDFRAKYNTPALAWDDTIAQSAMGHASQCIFEHTGLGELASQNREYGQNLWVSTVIPSSSVSLADAFNSWAENELQFYTGGFSEQAGHLTQVLWKSTTKVGCALKQCDGPIGGRVSYESGSLLTCEYDPAGNVEGGYEENVNL